MVRLSFPKSRRFQPVAVAVMLLASAMACGQSNVDTIYVVPGSHLDIGFTDTLAGVREQRIANLDTAIAVAENDPGFYWFEEGAWAFDAWHERNRGDEPRLAQVRRLLRADRFGVGATWVNPLVSAIPEGLPFLTFHLDEMEREFDYRPKVAVMNDVSSYPETLVDELAARGIRYLLVGANMFISRPLPERLVRRPFYWESSSGARVLTYIDPDSYTAGISLGPVCASAFDPERFPPDIDAMDIMQTAVDEMIGASDARYDALIVQQAFDNWDPECTGYLSGSAARWNESGREPRIELAPPERYFRHIEERYGQDLPVYRAEWGGQWDAQHWAHRPVTFWRLRQALRSAGTDLGREAKAAVATALGHSMGQACSNWGFDESQVRQTAREIHQVLERAIRLTGGPDATAVLPVQIPMPPAGPLPESWLGVLATDAAPARYRAGPNFVGPFIIANTDEWDIPFDFGADEGRLVIHSRIDRTTIPGSRERLTYLVIEIPLKAGRQSLRLAPEGVPNALMNDWLLGAPPNGIVTAPNGVRVIGTEWEITLTSPLVVSWSLHAPRQDQPDRTWLQGLIVAQSEFCELKGGRSQGYPFEMLFEGEPAIVDVDVELRFREE